MNFINDEHELFFVNILRKLQEQKKVDVYSASLVYTLGMCEETRKNFNQLFNIQDGEINIDSIIAPWQTDTSAKVTRMAFSLWNNCMYDSEQDAEIKKLSKNYNVGEIFSCSYAPYFYEGIKIRYPEYTKEIPNNSLENEIEK